MDTNDASARRTVGIRHEAAGRAGRSKLENGLQWPTNSPKRATAPRPLHAGVSRLLISCSED